MDSSKILLFGRVKVAKMTISFFDKEENMVGDEENAGDKYFLLFPKCFSQPSSIGVVKGRDCVVKR